MRPLFTRRIWTIALAYGLLMTSQIMAEKAKKITEIEGITEYRLDNGLAVLLFPDPSKPTVTVNLTIFVGSRHEGYGEAGMAHLLEHMLFKGTPTHPNIDKLMKQRGATINGTTWNDRTNYFETMPAKGDNLEFAIRLEADRMINSFIKAEDLASEMTVVRNEFERGENSPQRILVQRINAAAYDWHNYGKSTIGNRSDIERVPITNLRAFYRKHYQPDNAMLVVAGKFDDQEAIEYAEKHFGKIPRPERELDRTYTTEPAQDGERTVVLRRVGEVPLVGVAYHIPASPHKDFAACQVLSYIMAIEPAGRLYKALKEPKKAAGVYGWAQGFHDPGLMFGLAEVDKDGDLEDARKTLLGEFETVGTSGVTEEEVNRAKQKISKDREEELANSTRFAISLSNWAAQGDWRLFFLYRDSIEAVTAEDVTRVAQQYLKRNNRTVGLFIPTEEAERIEIPATPNVQELVRDYKGRESIAQGELFDPTPENIEKRTTRKVIGRNVQVALLPKKTRGGFVNLTLTLRYGDEKTLKGFETACRVLPTLMTRGTEKLTRQQIQDELDNNIAELSASGSLGSATFAVKTKTQNLVAVLEVLRQVLREPSLPAADLEVYLREQAALLEQQLNDPKSLALNRLRRVASPYPNMSVRYIPTIAEQLERMRAINRDQLQTLYDDFLGTCTGQLAIVGDFETKEIEPILARTFSDWDATHSYSHVPIVAFTDVSGGAQTIHTPDKENSNYFAGYVFEMNDSHPDYAAMIIGNHVLGGGSLSSRLGDRIRQKEGLSYGVGSFVHAYKLDERASLTLYAITNPENSPKVVKAIQEELDRFMKDGVTDEELDRAKQGYLERQTISRSNDAALASLLNDSHYADRTMDYHAEFEKKVAGLTTKDIHNAWQKHIDLSRLVIITAGDFPEAK